MMQSKLSDIAAEMLAEEMAKVGDPRTAPESEIRAACKRFTDRWTGAADEGQRVYLGALYALQEKPRA